MIAQGRDSIERHFLPTVPTPAEHFERQDPGEAGSMIRPHLMMKIEDDEFDWDVLDALGDAIASRGVQYCQTIFETVLLKNTTSTPIALL